MRKKILKAIVTYMFTCVYIFNNFGTIIAYDIQGQGSGTVYPVTGSDCGNGPCYGWSSGFQIRATLVDDKAKLVPGTKTIQFAPYQPAEGGEPFIWDDFYNLSTQKIKYNAGPIRTANDYFEGKAKGSSFNYGADVFLSDINTEENIVFLGSSRFDTMKPNVNNENKQHNVYMGIGNSKKENVGFADYDRLRQEFLQYITSINNRKTKIPGRNESVSFMDYFLYACGFTNSIEASKDYETLKKINERNYYIALEPVYNFGVRYNGKWHNVIGTGNQLAQFSLYNMNGLYSALMQQNGLKWPNNTNLPLGPQNYWDMLGYPVGRNAYCNFFDGKGLFNKGDANKGVSNNCNINPSTNMAIYWRNISIQSQPNMPFGIISLSISQLYKEVKLPQGLTYDISTCNNENFIFDSTLFAGRTNTELVNSKASIYDAISVLNNEDRQKYIYTTNTADGKELWCYDDVKYDFSDLKKLKNNEYKSGMLTEIPSGKLTVNRTCFSKQKPNDTTTLNNILVDDNIGSKQYQDEFIFKFNGKEYKYKRDDNIYPNNRTYNERMIESDNTIDRVRGIGRGYIYTGAFEYYYTLDEGMNSNEANLNITNLNTINTGNNILKFDNKYLLGKTITIPNTDTGTYINEMNVSLTNAFGLSTKTINQINESQNKTITYNEMSEKGNKMTNTTTEITFEITEDKNQSCKFETTVKNEDIMGSGVQFRVISLTNPFPARDGTSRLPGYNWLNDNENNVYTYIQNNRNIKSENKDAGAEAIYQKEPLYTITLTPSTMVKIREYNKSHTYSDFDMTCESETGRMCIDNFIRNNKYLPSIEGTCSSINAKEITNINNRIIEFEKSGCNNYAQCMTMRQAEVQELDFNKDNYVTRDDLLNADFYTCADKTALSGK